MFTAGVGLRLPSADPQHCLHGGISSMPPLGEFLYKETPRGPANPMFAPGPNPCPLGDQQQPTVRCRKIDTDWHTGEHQHALALRPPNLPFQQISSATQPQEVQSAPQLTKEGDGAPRRHRWPHGKLHMCPDLLQTKAVKVRGWASARQLQPLWILLKPQVSYMVVPLALTVENVGLTQITSRT
jgi:hypothetical protein